MTLICSIYIHSDILRISPYFSTNLVNCLQNTFRGFSRIVVTVLLPPLVGKVMFSSDLKRSTIHVSSDLKRGTIFEIFD